MGKRWATSWGRRCPVAPMARRVAPAGQPTNPTHGELRLAGGTSASACGVFAARRGSADGSGLLLSSTLLTRAASAGRSDLRAADTVYAHVGEVHKVLSIIY